MVLARESARILGRISAYDYALAGWFAGERLRVVTPERYSAALSGEALAVVLLKDAVMKAAFADRRLSTDLIQLADADVAIADDLGRFAAARDEAAFARIAQDVATAWAALTRYAALLPPDEELASAISRGSAWSVTLSRSPGFAVVTAPFGSREEALAAARRLGAYEQVATQAPFTIRVATMPDRASSDKRVETLAALGITAAVAEGERFTFARGGPDPAAELWREPALDVPTHAGARRASFLGRWIVVAAVDGTTSYFDASGKAAGDIVLGVGATYIVPAPDGKVMAVGGQVAYVVTDDGRVLGTPTRLPSSAAGAVWVERRKVFVVASQGPTGQPAGGGGAVAAIGRDGKSIGDPFPLVTPAAGPAVASSPARDEVFIATTSQGTTDVEAIRPGIDTKPRTLVRVAGQVKALVVDDDGAFAAVVTAQGTYRFRPGEGEPPTTLERVGVTSRDIAYAKDGTLYVAYEDKVVAYDRALRQLWSASVRDGRRVVVARRIVVQDGLRRVLLLDPASGAAEELAEVGELSDIAVSPDRGKVLLLGDGRRAVLFALP